MRHDIYIQVTRRLIVILFIFCIWYKLYLQICIYVNIQKIELLSFLHYNVIVSMFTFILYRYLCPWRKSNDSS